MTPRAFRALVWRFYKTHGRHDLPWRPTSLKLRRVKKENSLYQILVSEVMLQQTQVERVIPFYKKFIKQFPTAKRLAAAPLAAVLTAWQGLGYNRRAKKLHQAAKELTARSAKLSVAELEALPGVGHYTARAVAAFAYNEDVTFVETNIRTAIIHHFFMRGAGASPSRGAQAARPIQPLDVNAPAPRVSDAEILAALEKLLPKGRSGEWYSALMDYGAHLKRAGISHNARSRSYTKQKAFAGSLREARGAILRALTTGPQSGAALLALLGQKRRTQLSTALAALVEEQLVQKQGARYTLG